MSDFDAATAALKAAVAPTQRISPMELAEKLGVTPQAVHNWLSGTARPHVKHREAIERLAGVPRTWWLTDAERDAAGLPRNASDPEAA